MNWNAVTSIFRGRRAQPPVARPAAGRPVVYAPRPLTADEVAAALPPREAAPTPLPQVDMAPPREQAVPVALPAFPARLPVPPVDPPAGRAEPIAAAAPSASREPIPSVEVEPVSSNPPGTPFPAMPAMPSGRTPPATPPAPPAVRTAPPSLPAAPGTQAAGQQLVVGRGIWFSGRITQCDRLIVEGDVQATLTESRAIEVAAGGVYKGTAEIDEAEIGGLFEGELIVRGRLAVRTTGRLHGRVRYGSIEIQAGGEIAGDVALFGQEPPVLAQPAPREEPAPSRDPPSRDPILEAAAQPREPGERQAQELLTRNYRGPRQRH